MKRLALFLPLLLACSGDPTVDSSDEDLSKSFTFHCAIAHHSADTLKLRVSKTTAHVTTLDTSGPPDGTFTYDPNYVPRSSQFAGRVKYDRDADNTVLIMESSLRTGGTTGYLTIEGGHISRERQDFICRR